MTAENVTPGQSCVPSIVYVLPAPVAPYANTDNTTSHINCTDVKPDNITNH